MIFRVPWVLDTKIYIINEKDHKRLLLFLKNTTYKTMTFTLYIFQPMRAHFGTLQVFFTLTPTFLLIYNENTITAHSLPTACSRVLSLQTTHDFQFDWGIKCFKV